MSKQEEIEMTRKTPEEIARQVMKDPDQGPSIASAIAHGVMLAYEEADKYPIEGTWEWACQRMKEGWKVRKSSFCKGYYLHIVGTYIYACEKPAEISEYYLNATDWELYEEKEKDMPHPLQDEQIFYPETDTKETPVELKEGQIVSINGKEYKIFNIEHSDTINGRIYLHANNIPQWEEVSHDEAMEALKSGEYDVETAASPMFPWYRIYIKDEFPTYVDYEGGEDDKYVVCTLDRKWRIRKKHS